MDTNKTPGIPIDRELYLTQVKVAGLLDVSVTTVWRWAQKPDFPKRTDRKRYLRSEIVEWWNRRTPEAPKEFPTLRCVL